MKSKLTITMMTMMIQTKAVLVAGPKGVTIIPVNPGTRLVETLIKIPVKAIPIAVLVK